MFGIGLLELFVIFLVAIIVLDPNQLKEYLGMLKGLYCKFYNFKQEIHNHISELDKTIDVIGDDGKVYKGYKFKNIEQIKRKDDSTDTSS